MRSPHQRKLRSKNDNSCASLSYLNDSIIENEKNSHDNNIDNNSDNVREVDHASVTTTYVTTAHVTLMSNDDSNNDDSNNYSHDRAYESSSIDRNDYLVNTSNHNGSCSTHGDWDPFFDVDDMDVSNHTLRSKNGSDVYDLDRSNHTWRSRVDSEYRDMDMSNHSARSIAGVDDNSASGRSNNHANISNISYNNNSNIAKNRSYADVASNR